MTLNAFEANVLAQVRHEITKEIADRSRPILSGNIKDMEDYKRIVGFCHGLQRALELMDKVTNPPRPAKPLIRNIG